MSGKDNIIKPRPVSGFPEWLPEQELAFRNYIEIITRAFEAFGFTPIETPAAELLEILASKGEINKQIYGLYRPNAAEEERETELALHFDLTVPLARYVAMNFDKISFPFRRYQIQKVWRGERPQRGRFREFYQCDIDVVGSEKLDPLNDAEMPAVIYRIFREMNIGEFVIRVSNRKILQGFMKNAGITGESSQEALRAVDRLPKTGKDAVLRDLQKDAGLNEETASGILELAALKGKGARVLEKASEADASHPLFREGVEELEMLVNNLGALGVPEDAFEIDLSITRGLDYYTGTVYETFLPEYPELGSVCSGGRYDNLASLFTKQKLPGVGISIGLTRLFSHLLEAGKISAEFPSRTKVLVTVMDRERLSDYFAIASELRDAGIPTEVYLENKRMKHQFKHADRKNIPLVLIAGGNEFAEGTVQVKNMKTGDQTPTPRSELTKTIQKQLG